MAENLTQNQIITIAGRKKMLRARADVNGGKMRLGMENGHLYYEEL